MRKAIHTLVITATTVCLALPLDEGLARQPETAVKPIDVGSQSQLFVDRYLIESEKAIELVVHPPKKMERVLVPERPWEAYRVFVQSVLRDGDVYRMYYSCIPSKPAGKGGTIKCRNCRREVPDNTVICQCGWSPSSELQQRMFGNLAYAESQDGIHWEKPALGLREFDGNKSNNLLPNAGPVVSMIPEPVQGMRFLSLPATDDIIRLSGSRDGRTFEVLAEGLSPFLLDTANQILWDPNHEKYVAYLRGFPGRRVVVRAEIDDPTKAPWPHNEGADLNVKKGSKYVTTELPIVMDGNTLGTYEIYNPALNIYPHRKGGVYLAFPTVYRAYPRQPDRPRHNYNKAPNDGMAEIYLLVSRDGKNFTIPAKTAYVSPGTEEEPDRGYLSMAVGMIEKGDELWQYYTGVEVTHGVVDPDRRSGTGGAYRLVQKRDRFAGARAGHAGGEIVTQPLVFSGNRLEINVDCGGLGEAWVEILDEAGRPIPGFEMDRFDVIDMNHVHAACAWMENPDVGKLAGRPVKLRFKLRAATLYSFRFLQAYFNCSGSWVRPRRPNESELEYQIRNFQYFVWVAGDFIVEAHVHNLDACNWIANDHPVEANGMGARRNPEDGNFGQTFDQHMVEFTYANGVKLFSQCRYILGCWSHCGEDVCGTEGRARLAGWVGGEQGVSLSGKEEWRYKGAKVNPWEQELADLIAAIRENRPYHEGWYGATSSFTGVLGRMATYSGQVVRWDEAVAKGPREMPQNLALDADPPVLPDADGRYAVPRPGTTAPF